MTNYIGKIEAEWVDPAVELPPENGYYYARSRDGSCWPAYFSRTDDGRGLWGVPVFAWLRIGGPLTADDQLRAALSRVHDEEMGDSIDKPLACHDAFNRIAIRLREIIYQHIGALLPLEDLSEVRRPEDGALETARNNLIAEMADHGYHAEDAAAEVDGLICVCLRNAIPRAKVQAAVDGIESRRCAIPGQSYDPHRQGVESGLAQGLRELRDHTGVTPSEVTDA